MSTQAPNSNGTAKRGGRPINTRRYAYQEMTGKGRALDIDKFLLHVDHDYQRDDVNESRVFDIAKNWSWTACGTLSVARRPDGQLWVFDGQHRLLAARKREDIQTLPCLVFDVSECREEARSFVEANTNRGPMKASSKFKGRLAAEEANALRVAAALSEVGYRVGKTGPGTLQCIAAVERAFSKDYDTAMAALTTCVDICKGDPIKANVFSGLFALETHLRKEGGRDSILTGHIRTKLLSTTQDALMAKTRESAAYNGKSGEKVYAEGIVRFINKHKTAGRRLPSLL